MNGDIFKAYFSSENKWMKSNGGYYDEVIDDVVAWFPIPSFEGILEANKDVLERIKEKGVKMKYHKVKKKQKFERVCYNCKHYYKCTDRFNKDTINCDKFKFNALCKSV